MTVRELISMLENFDDDMEIVIGMKQRYGTNFAMCIADVNEFNVNVFYGEDCRVVVITEGGQCGSVDYYEDDDWF